MQKIEDILHFSQFFVVIPAKICYNYLYTFQRGDSNGTVTTIIFLSIQKKEVIS